VLSTINKIKMEVAGVLQMVKLSKHYEGNLIVFLTCFGNVFRRFMKINLYVVLLLGA